MQKHTKTYFKAYGYDESDFIPCEICGQTAVDTHHIKSRGRGGKDEPENLMALCRKDHIKYGDKEQYIEFLTEKHNLLKTKNL